MERDTPLEAFFYETSEGKSPVLDWLRSLPKTVRHEIGSDIDTVQRCWPVGMPTVRPMGGGLHEVRTSFSNGIARVLFCVDKKERIILLHGFIKKSQQTPDEDLELARKRRRSL